MAYADVNDDVPAELLMYLADGLAKLCAAEELKQDVPLLLCGFVIEELKLLVNQLAGPSAICTAGGRSWTLIGSCTGLLRLGLLDATDLRTRSDAVVHGGAPIGRALKLLLYRSRPELEAISNRPLFGNGPWSLMRVLAEHYQLTLADFD